MKINDNSLEPIILDIESSAFHTIEKKTVSDPFELWRDPAVLKNLSGNIGAIFVRTLLKKLNVNEHHVFRWRLENKYRQYQVLNYYMPGCVPETIGLSQLLSRDDGISKIKALCQNDFFIKATLGHRSGELKSFDRTDELDNIIHSDQKEEEDLEKWVLQKKLNLQEEFRIHTFSRDIIYGLTFIMKGLDSSKSSCAEKFVGEILEKLPETISQGTLIGWDIGITDTNEYYVIEANITGFHPQFARGFQTSGYFGDPEFGSVMCAWLNNYFRIKYGVFIDAVESSLLSSNLFYKEFMYYASLFRNNHIEFLRNKVKNTGIAAVMYLGEHILRRLITLLEYFQEENFADIYYLIIDAKNVSLLSGLFPENVQIRILIEEELFTEDQYQLIKQFSHERRRKICSYHALRVIKEKSFFMV